MCVAVGGRCCHCGEDEVNIHTCAQILVFTEQMDMHNQA